MCSCESVMIAVHDNVGLPEFICTQALDAIEFQLYTPRVELYIEASLGVRVKIVFQLVSKLGAKRRCRNVAASTRRNDLMRM